jgi:hypothetical protein
LAQYNVNNNLTLKNGDVMKILSYIGGKSRNHLNNCAIKMEVPMSYRHFRGVMALVLSLTVITSLVFCASVSGGDKCLLLHSVIVEGNMLDSPRAGGRDKGEYMMGQDFCLSEKCNRVELTGRASTGTREKSGWGGATTMLMLPPERIPVTERCEAIWDIVISADISDNPNAYVVSCVIYVLEFKEDRSITGGREHSFRQSIELDKEFLIPIGPMGGFENVSLAAKLTIDDSE